MNMNIRTRISILVIVILYISSLVFADYVAEDFEVIESKANAGDAYYQGLLGMMYLNSFDVARDYKKAYAFSKQSAEAGNTVGMYQLDVMNAYKKIWAKDSLDTQEHFQESITKLKEVAVKEDAIIQFCIGHAYLNGFGVEKDLGKALEWNMKSMLQGYDQAEMYFNGLLSDDACSGEVFERIRDFLQKESAENSFAEYALGNVYANTDSLNKDIDKAIELFSSSQKGNNDHGCKPKKGDIIIPNLLPPSYYLAIKDGSCAENCLWTIMNSLDRSKTQLEINLSGTKSGRGIHSGELMQFIKKFNIGFTKHYQSVDSSDSLITSQRYKDYIYNKVVKNVKEGYPMIIGVKSYPTQNPQWFLDHFVLVVGYNERTDELIFNDLNKRKRISVKKLLDSLPGYSFVNVHNMILTYKLLDFRK